MKRGFSSWREGGLLLGLIRGLALCLALVQNFIFDSGNAFFFQDELVIGVIAAYTIARLIYPFNWYGRKYASYLLVTSDVIICCTLPFVTGGFNSPFILYPLSAILSASLFFPRKTAYTVATFVAVTIIASELFSRLVLNIDMLLPVQLYIVLMTVYIFVGYLIAWLPYLGNINFYDTIRKRATETERSRLSRELHDGPAQRVAALLMKLELIEESWTGMGNKQAITQIEDLKRELKIVHDEIREAIDQMRTGKTENPGIVSSLAQYTREFSRNSGIPCHIYLADGHTDLDASDTVELLRVAQEALANVRTHSKANKVEVRFETQANLIIMIIKDNGRGFSTAPNIGHHGLAVMQERARNLGGKCEIISSPGSGTEIRVTIPHNSKVSRQP